MLDAGSPDADSTGPERNWSRIRRRAALVYLAALVLIIVFVGVPTDRGSLLLIIVVGLGVACLGRGWKAFGRVLLDWLPFTAALVIWDFSRGIARVIGMPLHIGDVAAVDRFFFGQIPTVYLQQHFFEPGRPQWYDAVATLTYATHFLATPIVAALLWLRNREVWIRFVRRVLLLAAAGLLTYVLFPAAPPWYAAREGAIAPVVRASSRGWLWLHVNHAGNLLQEGQAASNPVAAMPSLHTAYATLIAVFVVSLFASRWRWLILAYPVVMAVSLVYLGEHYVVDVVAGVVYAVAVHIAASKWESRQPRRARALTETRPEVTPTRRS